ncbi:hypothetical protein GQ53DRAFT_756235 [Thozetella sp. PMI_491]|nr:hypothetical protein GQ53DRAFT_756235 [Thozetella sp. PMI_491]
MILVICSHLAHAARARRCSQAPFLPTSGSEPVKHQPAGRGAPFPQAYGARSR